MALQTDHSNTITVNIVLSASPPVRQGFGNALLIVNQDDGNSLNGVRVKTYTSVAEAQTDRTATYISAATLAAVTALFSQQPTPARVKVGYIDVGASETYAAALTAIRAIDDDWYGVAIYSRADADILAVSSAIESMTPKKIFVAQSADASWLNSGVPTALAALASRERTAVVYHDTAAQWADLAWLASRLVFDPDFQSAGWEGQVRGVNALTTPITPAERDFIVANYANVGLPFSSAAYYTSPGVNTTGRALYEIVSADWFGARVSEDLALLKLEHTLRGEKLLVDATGQAKCLAILNVRLAQGVTAGHFVRGQIRATAETITSDDLTNRRLRFKAEAQIGADARLFTINAYLQRDALQDA